MLDTMKKRLAAGLGLLLCLGLVCGCAPPTAAPAGPDKAPRRVVALSSSLAEVWLLAGGELAGTTSDTLERGLEGVDETTALVGTVKEPGLEAILALEPDFVLYSADLASHTALAPALAEAGIAAQAAHIETFEEYLEALQTFCTLTGRDDLYESNGVAVQKQIDGLMAAYTPPEPPPSYLLLRVHSSGGKAIADDHVAVDVLDALGADNIAARQESLLSDLSLEAVLTADPDHIFVVTMGEEDKALATLEQMFTSQPAWQTLRAVQNSRVQILPKALFHYKPNANWGEAYAVLIGHLTA